MKTIKYRFCDGEISEVEVTDELGEIIAELDRETENNERRETRRHHISLEQAGKRLDTEIADKRVNVLAEVIGREDMTALYSALNTLTPEQKVLVNRVYFEEQSIKDIALDFGVSFQAVQNRLKRILLRLRKQLKK